MLDQDIYRQTERGAQRLTVDTSADVKRVICEARCISQANTITYLIWSIRLITVQTTFMIRFIEEKFDFVNLSMLSLARKQTDVYCGSARERNFIRRHPLV